MSQIPAIPEKHYPQISLWLADGLSGAKIKKRLLDEFQLEVSDKAIYTVINKIKKDRQQIAQVVLTKEIEKTAAIDLHQMNEVINTLFTKFTISSKTEEIDKTLKIAAELNKWNSRRMELTGINKIDERDPDLEEGKNELLKKLEGK